MQITDNNYLSTEDIAKKNRINQQIKSLMIPEEIINSFSVIPPENKIDVYMSIKALDENSINLIKKFISNMNMNNFKGYDEMQLILDVIRPMVKEENIAKLIDSKFKSKYSDAKYSVCITIIDKYLTNGLKGLIDYNLINNNNNYDDAINKATSLVYRDFKYQFVKYFGFFDIAYRYRIASETNVNVDDIQGISKLLQRFEYNASTDEGKFLSDYGVPPRLVDFYDNRIKSKDDFDEYEKYIDKKIQKILKK